MPNQACGGHAHRFEPERFLEPRNEGKDESGKDSVWTGFLGALS